MGFLEGDQFEVDDILENSKKVKRKKSGDKGKRAELELTKILTARFNKPFSRVPQSGALGHVGRISEHVREAYVGDIITPPTFRYCIECKHGYNNDIDFNKVIGDNKPSRLIDQFLEQAERDAERLHREPLLCWKPDRSPWICFTKTHPTPAYHLCYRGWQGWSLERLLEQSDSFFFVG